MVKQRGDSLTGDLLSWEPPKVAAGFDAGAIRGNRLASQISQAVALALKHGQANKGLHPAHEGTAMGQCIFVVQRDRLQRFADGLG